MTWLKLIFSRLGGFLKPFLQLFLSEIGPILAETATRAVQTVAQTATDSESDDDKRARAQKLILGQLRQRGIEIGAGVTISMINAALEAAVQKVKANG
jgi:hypothetical protein